MQITILLKALMFFENASVDVLLTETRFCGCCCGGGGVGAGGEGG